MRMNEKEYTGETLFLTWFGRLLPLALVYLRGISFGFDGKTRWNRLKNWIVDE
jgi:hypothetical protein